MVWYGIINEITALHWETFMKVKYKNIYDVRW